MCKRFFCILGEVRQLLSISFIHLSLTYIQLSSLLFIKLKLYSFKHNLYLFNINFDLFLNLNPFKINFYSLNSCSWLSHGADLAASSWLASSSRCTRHLASSMVRASCFQFVIRFEQFLFFL